MNKGDVLIGKIFGILDILKSYKIFDSAIRLIYDNVVSTYFDTELSDDYKFKNLNKTYKKLNFITNNLIKELKEVRKNKVNNNGVSFNEIIKNNEKYLISEDMRIIIIQHKNKEISSEPIKILEYIGSYAALNELLPTIEDVDFDENIFIF